MTIIDNMIKEIDKDIKSKIQQIIICIVLLLGWAVGAYLIFSQNWVIGVGFAMCGVTYELEKIFKKVGII